MKWYLLSGSSKPLHANKFLTEKLKFHNSQTLLIISGQSTKGAQKAFEETLELEPSILEIVKPVCFSPKDYHLGKYKLTDFDSIYVKGGLYEYWDEKVVLPSGPEFLSDLKNFLFKDDGFYFGASLGLQILFDKFHSRMETGEEHLSYWYDHGLGIFKNILTEVHVSPPSDVDFLKKRHIETLMKYPEFTHGVLFSADCLIEIDSRKIDDWKTLSGKYKFVKRP